SPLPQQVLERVALIRKAHRTMTPPVTVEDLAAATGLTVDEVSDTLAADRFAKMMSWEQTAEPNGFGPASAFDPPSADAERWEEIRQPASATETLPPKERLAVTLYYREDLRLKEIAEIMQLSVSRVSRLLSKATFELGEVLRGKLGVAGGC